MTPFAHCRLVGVGRRDGGRCDQSDLTSGATVDRIFLIFFFFFFFLTFDICFFWAQICEKEEVEKVAKGVASTSARLVASSRAKADADRHDSIIVRFCRMFFDSSSVVTVRRSSSWLQHRSVSLKYVRGDVLVHRHYARGALTTRDFPLRFRRFSSQSAKNTKSTSRYNNLDADSKLCAYVRSFIF
jgi:hypothetical protein